MGRVGQLTSESQLGTISPSKCAPLGSPPPQPSNAHDHYSQDKTRQSHQGLSSPTLWPYLGRPDLPCIWLAHSSSRIQLRCEFLRVSILIFPALGIKILYLVLSLHLAPSWFTLGILMQTQYPFYFQQCPDDSHEVQFKTSLDWKVNSWPLISRHLCQVPSGFYQY